MHSLAAALVALTLGACASAGNGVPDRAPATAPQDVESAEPIEPGEELDPDAYLLGQGDRISIQVFDEPDLTMEATIGSSGSINYSYLGDVKVAGKTSQQIERAITTSLENGFLVNPSVNVTVAEYRPFFINGEVRSPGGYPYQPGLTLDRALALAGGMTDRASSRKIFIMKAGKADEELRAGMSTRIAPGDIISVKEGFF